MALLLAGAGGARAQDLEHAARALGRHLPQGDQERLRQDTGFFARGGWVARADRAAAAGAAVEGDLPLVAVLALFADSPEPHVSTADMRAALFDGPSANGTLREFYAEASGGRLNIAGGVVPWVRTSLTRAEVVGSEYGLGGDSRVGEYLVEALSLADPAIDFGQFDNDGPDNIPNSGDDNGVVDAIAFYFIEVAASCGGPGIWPHFFGISPWTGAPYETDDPRPGGGYVVIDPYFIQSAVDCSGVDVAPIHTVAHELGHLIGLPDLYHPVDGLLAEQRRWVIGCWSLMAAGSWGCGPVAPTTWTRPTHMGAWEKKRLGWLDRIEVVSGTELEEILLPPVETSRSIVEIPLGEQERLLLEYRLRTGFDQDLPASGVLAYRINDTLPFRPPPEALPLYRVQLLEADGNDGLVRTALQGGNRGEAGDAYGALGVGTLTNATYPSTRPNAGLGEESDVNIYEVTLTGSGARLLVSTAPISTERLVASLLLDEANALTAGEERFLDERNNGNGRYDVGDLRAYFQRDR